jgi:flagellar assembly factor FliW
MPALRIRTTRFGFVAIEPEDVFFFPLGMLGLDGCLHWVLLADADNDALGWLQCITRAEIALAVVSPRRFVPDYQVRIARSELGPLALDPLQEAQVLVIVSKNERSITLNLKAPLVINLQRRIGRQVITNVDQPLQFELSNLESPRKKIA